jgi:hypothetical protein
MPELWQDAEEHEVHRTDCPQGQFAMAQQRACGRNEASGDTADYR